MWSSPIIIFYCFVILVVFVMGVAPTAFWKGLWASFAGAAVRSRQDRLAAQFVRATAGAAFTADIDYVPVGIGFAVDRSRGLVFVAGEQSEGVVPLAALRAHATGVITGGFTDENYVDLFPKDSTAPTWRISCGEDVGSAEAIDRELSALGVMKA